MVVDMLRLSSKPGTGVFIGGNDGMVAFRLVQKEDLLPRQELFVHALPDDRPKTMATIPYDRENVFAKIIEGKIPSFKIFETEHVLAILDAFPLAPGHALLLPKATGYATIMDMPAEVAAELFRELPRLAKAVQEATGADGINIIQNNGPAAGQVVFHLHIHVIPRFNDDGLLKLAGGSVMINKDDGMAMLGKIQGKL